MKYKFPLRDQENFHISLKFITTYHFMTPK